MKRAVVSLAAIFTVATLMILMTTMVPARASNDTRVTIIGDVSVGGITFHVQAQASGSSSSLSGQGISSPLANSVGPGNTARFPLTGSVSGSTVTLTGSIAFSPNAANIGMPIAITADSSTGYIEFDFGLTKFTGTGSVVIN